jgi:hypothetical protein
LDQVTTVELSGALENFLCAFADHSCQPEKLSSTAVGNILALKRVN